MEREDGSITIAAGPRQRTPSRVLRSTHDQILLSQLSVSHSGGRSFRIPPPPPRNRLAQLYA
jgi:hypothetical protein